jgi:DNA-binding XRE family transcriptional regulator
MHLKTLGLSEHNNSDAWEIYFHDGFLGEFGSWSQVVQDAVLSSLGKLRVFGPSLGRPSVDTLKGSNYPNMKELRVDAESGVWRIAFAFDPKRRAILLTGGNKTGISKDRFYSTLIRVADLRYEQYLKSIGAKGGQEMTVSLEEILRQLPEERRRRIEQRAAELIAEELNLREVRRLRKLTQARLSKKLNIGQEGVSRIEKRSDLYISTLRGYIEGLGGKLKLVVELPDRPPVILAGFGESSGRKMTRKSTRSSPKSKSKTRRAA